MNGWQLKMHGEPALTVQLVEAAGTSGIAITIHALGESPEASFGLAVGKDLDWLINCLTEARAALTSASDTKAAPDAR